MINLILLLVFIACLGMVAAWVAENPGTVTIHWYDYRIDTSFAFLLLLALMAAIALAWAYVIVRRLIMTPKHVVQSHELKRHRRGLTELTHSVAALAAADVASAEIHTRKAEKLLGRTPLTLMLSAQVARSRGDDAATRLLLEQMLQHKETEYLAARSLSDAASKQQAFPRALALAERAHALNPGETSSVASIVSLHSRLGQWQQAILAINKAVRKGRLNRTSMRHYKGVVHLQQGMALMKAGRPEETLAVARAALKELPDFIPAVIFAAKAFAAAEQQRQALKLLMSHWKKSPHPLLADTLREIIAHEPKEEQKKILDKMTGLHPEISSPAVWICSACGHADAHWAAHCTNCGAFCTLAWKPHQDIKFASGL